MDRTFAALLAAAADPQGLIEREVLRSRGAIERQNAARLREAAAVNRYLAHQERAYALYLRAEYGALKGTAPAASWIVAEERGAATERS